MKTKIFLLAIAFLLLVNCRGGGPDLPPFEYADNSRIIIEGILQNPDGSAVQNQRIELLANRYGNVFVNSTLSDVNGKFFISAPKANYEYSIVFINRNIISMQNSPFLLIENKDNPPLFLGSLSKLIKNYYDFKIIKIISI